MPDLRFPIGPAPEITHLTPEHRRTLLAELAGLPTKLREVAPQIDWDTPYREGSWTRRQLIHHLADSHMNGYVRCKLILTEDTPIIRPYSPEAWVSIDSDSLDPEVSIQLLSGLHARWVSLLENLPETAWSRTCIHPEMVGQGEERPIWAGNFIASGDGQLTLDSLLSTYAWHGNHHLAHLMLPVTVE